MISAIRARQKVAYLNHPQYSAQVVIANTLEREALAAIEEAKGER
jgi:hypothetical protein